MSKEDGQLINYRTEAEYWDSHSPHDDCTLEPELFTITYPAGANVFSRQNINSVNNIINGFQYSQSEPIRTVPDGQSKNTILPLNDLPVGSLIRLDKEIIRFGRKGGMEYGRYAEYGSIQQTDPNNGEKYLHLRKPPHNIHVAYPNSNIQIGEVKHIKLEGQYDNYWYLERVLSAQLLVYAKPELKTALPSEKSTEPKKKFMERFLRK